MPRFLVGFLVLAATSCTAPAPRVPSWPGPELHRVRVEQRSSAFIPGTDRGYWVGIGDVSAGEAMVKLGERGQPHAIFQKVMRLGDAASCRLGDREWVFGPIGVLDLLLGVDSMELGFGTEAAVGRAQVQGLLVRTSAIRGELRRGDRSLTSAEVVVELRAAMARRPVTSARLFFDRLRAMRTPYQVKIGGDWHDLADWLDGRWQIRAQENLVMAVSGIEAGERVGTYEIGRTTPAAIFGKDTPEARRGFAEVWGLSFEFAADNRLSAVVVVSKSYLTTAGAYIGASVADVRRAHGDPVGTRYRGLSGLAYPGLFFAIEDERVTSIHVFAKD